jgi:hypothetical protein
LIEVVAGNLYATGKQFASEHVDFAPLLDDRFCRLIRFGREFRLMNLKVEALEALAARDKLRFAESDHHRSDSSCILSMYLSLLRGFSVGRKAVLD